MIVNTERNLRKFLQRARNGTTISRTRLTLPSESLLRRRSLGFSSASTEVMALGWRKWYRVEGWVAEMGADPLAHPRALSSRRREES